MKRCELCKSAAMIFCESDQASLCWDCDARVHSANFLVARHSRTLLCHACQSPTAWSASGGRLGRTVSVCPSCVDGCERAEEVERERGDGVEIDVEDDEYGDFDDQDDEDEDEEVSGDDEDGDNQVVPWSSTPPPPPATSSSSSEDSSNRFCNRDREVSLKRLRENEADLHSNDDLGCSSSYRRISSPPPLPPAEDSEAALVDSTRPSKRRITEPSQSFTAHHGPAGSRTTAIVEFLKRFHEQDVSSAIIGICELSKNPGAVDFGSSDSS